MVTVGRLLFAAVVRWLPGRAVYHLLPIVLVATFTLIADVPDNPPWLGVGVWGLAPRSDPLRQPPGSEPALGEGGQRQRERGGAVAARAPHDRQHLFASTNPGLWTADA
jgi:hypothetical protein